jgi:hypothetical protein
MTFQDWTRVMDEAVALGIREIQFIGGEPTQHPEFEALVRYALGLGAQVEVFTNLVAEPPWELYLTPGVRLATSYYSDDPGQHARITRAANSHRLTTKHIRQAVERGVSIRAMITRLSDDQRVQEAEALLRELGVTSIRHEDVRQVGRADVLNVGADTEQLCGGCTSVVAVLPNGAVAPCVMGRQFAFGNVKGGSLSAALGSRQYDQTMALLEQAFQERLSSAACSPWDDLCSPGWSGCLRQSLTAQ